MLSMRFIQEFGHLDSHVAICLDLTMCDSFTSLMVGRRDSVVGKAEVFQQAAEGEVVKWGS